MPDPLSATLIVDSSIVTVISGGDALLLAGVERVVDELLHCDERPVVAAEPALQRQLLLGHEIQEPRRREGLPIEPVASDCRQRDARRFDGHAAAPEHRRRRTPRTTERASRDGNVDAGTNAPRTSPSVSVPSHTNRPSAHAERASVLLRSPCGASLTASVSRRNAVS